MSTIRRRRLSTISSEKNMKDSGLQPQEKAVDIEIQEVEKPEPMHNPNQYRRRESSYTDMLDDPLRYQELIKKCLGQGEEDDFFQSPSQQKEHKGSMPKRNRTSSFIMNKDISRTPLEEIEEEKKDPVKNEVIKPKEVDFIKSQFQQFTLADSSPVPHNVLSDGL